MDVGPTHTETTYAEQLVMAEREAHPASERPDGDTWPRFAVEARGGGFVAPGRGAFFGLASRVGGRFGALALDVEIAILSVVPSRVAPPSTFPERGPPVVEPLFWKPGGVYAPTTILVSVIPSELIELGIGPTIDVLATTGPNDVVPFAGATARIGLRVPVARGAARGLRLVLSGSPHMTFADVPVLSLHASVGLAWE